MTHIEALKLARETLLFWKTEYLESPGDLTLDEAPLNHCMSKGDVALQAIDTALKSGEPSGEVVEAAFNSVPKWQWITDHRSAFKAAIAAMNMGGYGDVEADQPAGFDSQAPTSEPAMQERRGVNQWKLAEWLHDFEADLDSHGVILRPWETQPQGIREAYYHTAGECLETVAAAPTSEPVGVEEKR